MVIEYITENPNILSKIRISKIQAEDIVDNNINIKIPSIIKSLKIDEIGKPNEHLIIFDDEPSFSAKYGGHGVVININFEEGPTILNSIRAESGIISVKFPESLNTIKESAGSSQTFNNISFENTNITIIPKNCFTDVLFKNKVIISSNIKRIENGAFTGSFFEKGLSFSAASELDYIGDSAFFFASIKESCLIFPTSLKTIDKNAFARVKHLNAIEFVKDSKIRDVNKEAFAFSSLKKAIIRSNDYVFFEESCFSGSAKLKSMDISEARVRSIPFGFCYNNTKLTDVKFSSNVNTIKEHSFENCDLQNLKLPKAVEVIGASAFENSNIETVNFDELTSLNKIGVSAFANNYIRELPKGIFRKVNSCGLMAFCNNNFKKLHLEALNDTGIILSFVFTDNLCLEELVLENTSEGEWTHIGNSMFLNCIKLKTVTLPNTIVHLGEKCFNHTNIENITLDSVRVICTDALSNCENLKRCDFSKSPLEVINKKAFAQDTNLEELKLPLYFSNIDKTAFEGLTPKQITKLTKESPFLAI